MMSINESVRIGLDFQDHLFVYEVCCLPILIIVHFFTFYLIIWQTPKVMYEYRKYLLMVQTLMLWWELVYHMLIRPMFFYPYMASGCTGLLSRYFGLGCHYQCCALIGTLFFILTALNSTMVYRRNQMTPPGRWKLSRAQLGAIHMTGYIFTIANIVFFIVGGGEYMNEIPFVDPRMADVTTVIYHMGTLTEIWFVILFAVVIWILLFAALFIISIYCQLSKIKSIMNERTFELQKTFGKVLVKQLLSMVFILVLPLTINFVAVFSESEDITFLQTLTVVPSFFSMTYTVILIISTPVYRNATVAIVTGQKYQRLPRKSVSVSTIMVQ
ncbi:unnamed protein product, partial [Mesorhabditis spiculigera]